MYPVLFKYQILLNNYNLIILKSDISKDKCRNWLKIYIFPNFFLS